MIVRDRMTNARRVTAAQTISGHATIELHPSQGIRPREKSGPTNALRPAGSRTRKLTKSSQGRRNQGQARRLRLCSSPRLATPPATGPEFAFRFERTGRKIRIRARCS
jgi:hypothetical protein